jgi:hypothetical protein
MNGAAKARPVRIGIAGLHELDGQLAKAAGAIKLEGVQFVDVSRHFRNCEWTDAYASKSALNKAAEKFREMLATGELDSLAVVASGHQIGYVLHALKMPVDILDSHVDSPYPPEFISDDATNVWYGDHISHSLKDKHQTLNSITFYKSKPDVEGGEWLEGHLKGVKVREWHEISSANSPVRDADSDAFCKKDGLNSPYGCGNAKYAEFLESLRRNPPKAVGLFELPRLYSEKAGNNAAVIKRLLTALAQGHMLARGGT